MKKSTRKALFWTGVVLVLLPTILLVLLQPREYQSSVFIEVTAPGEAKRPPPLIERDTLYGLLFLIGIYLPGVFLVFIAWRSWRRERILSATPTT